MPTLLMRGTDDKYVSEQETQEIFSNIKGPKKLVEFSKTGHESYCIKDHTQWVNEVVNFLK